MWLRPDAYSEEHGDYLAALGRALALAQNFEGNLKFALGTADMATILKEGELSPEQWKAIGKKLHKRSLGAVLRDRDDVSPSERAALDAGRQARNFLAHEAAREGTYVPPPNARRKVKDFLRERPAPAVLQAERADMLTQHMDEAAQKLEAAVRALAAADNLVAGWSYVIQEKEDHLPSSASWYEDTVVAWVMEPLRPGPA